MDTFPSRAPSLGGAAAAGLISWAIVHRRPVRGDQAVLLLALALGVQYCVVSLSERPSHHAQSATLVLYLTYLTSLLAALLFYRLSPWHPLASYPGPVLARITSLWLTYSSLWGERYKAIDDLHSRYGEFVRIGPNILSVSSASVIPLYGIMEKSKTYQRHIRSEGFELFFKPDSTAQHRERKRLWAKLFTSTGLSQLMPNLERRTIELLQCMQRRQLESETGFLDIKEIFSHWAFDFTADVIFGGCGQFELMKKGDPLGISLTGKLTFAILDTLGPTSWIMEILCNIPALKRATAMLTAMMEALHMRMNSTPNFPDLASFLLVGDVPQDDILWDACIAIIGGSDNLAVMLTLAVFFMLTEPKYYQRLRKELDEAFPDPGGSLPPAELAVLPFLNGVLAEVLRLSTPFFLPRIVPSSGVVIDGRFVPGGTIVAYAAYTQQLHPDNFCPEPREFHPDRWLPGGLGPQTRADKSVLASFTFGPYACIGKPLAYREMRHALARLVLAFDMTLPSDFDRAKWREGIINMHTTFFRHKLPVRVSLRPGVKLDKHFTLLDS